MTPDKVLICPHCPRRFNMEAHLQRHVNAYHPDSEEAKAAPKAETSPPPPKKKADGPVDPEAPYGRKKDGTPMKRRGRRAGPQSQTPKATVATGSPATGASTNGILGTFDSLRAQLADVVTERDDLLDRFIALSNDHATLQGQLNAAKEALK